MTEMTQKIEKTDEQWKAELDRDAYEVLRKGATERPFTGKYALTKDAGMYRCGGCGAELFSSDTKFDSGTGWPSFTEPANRENVKFIADRSHGMLRTEVQCASCGGHLGHVFDDGPGDAGGKRFCINSCALTLDPAQPDG